MSEGPQLNWPEWLLATTALVGGFWTFLKTFFGLVTRKELEVTLLKMHEENKEGRQELVKEMRELATSLANLKGRFDQSQQGNHRR